MESSVSASPYVLVPQRLCLDLRDNPTAIGVYALIARLFLVNHQAIPLSAGDLQRFDPQISYGQARRALERLHTQGWVVQQALGRKNSYQPTWGHVKGQIHVWDATLAKLGRPAHVRNYRVAAAQLDQIAYLTPHTHLTAVIARGGDTTTLAQLGQQILHNAHLLPEPPTVVETAAVQEPLFFVPAEPIDQLIGEPIDPNQASETLLSASECRQTQIEPTQTDIPWESWDHHESTNQHAMPYDQQNQAAYQPHFRVLGGAPHNQVAGSTDHDTQQNNQHVTTLPPRAPAHAVNPTSDTVVAPLDQLIAGGHRLLNPGRAILAGEWWELARMQQQYGVADLLIWQARAARRREPIEQITPDYYQVCAERAALECWQAVGSAEPPPVRASVAPTPPLRAQLEQLGIGHTADLGQLDPALVAAWVAASQHPDWSLIWSDPGAAARALLLRGEAPPDAATIARRAAARKQQQPADWAALAATYQSNSQLDTQLDDQSDTDAHQASVDAPAVASDNTSVSDDAATPASLDPTEQLQILLRCYASRRQDYQAIDRLQVQCDPLVMQVVAARTDDLTFLRGLLPVIARIAAGRQIQLACVGM